MMMHVLTFSKMFWQLGSTIFKLLTIDDRKKKREREKEKKPILLSTFHSFLINICRIIQAFEMLQNYFAASVFKLKKKKKKKHS